MANSVWWVTLAAVESSGAGGRRFILGAKEDEYWKLVLMWASYKIPAELLCLSKLHFLQLQNGVLAQKPG